MRQLIVFFGILIFSLPAMAQKKKASNPITFGFEIEINKTPEAEAELLKFFKPSLAPKIKKTPFSKGLQPSRLEGTKPAFELRSLPQTSLKDLIGVIKAMQLVAKVKDLQRRGQIKFKYRKLGRHPQNYTQKPHGIEIRGLPFKK